MTESTQRLGLIEQLWRPVGRLAVYYVGLAALFWLLVSINPWIADHMLQVPKEAATGISLDAGVEPLADSSVWSAVGAMLTMSWSLLFVLPIIWVYTFARQKKGFQQSLAQTLVFLPVVVSVVVVLVKHSVALGFSLGGIVGAVAFRHRLQDTKDAVYVFVAIAIGLAVGTRTYSMAFAISVFFNFLALILWATDFARAPAPLAAEIMRKRVKLAKGNTENRQTDEYVTQLDQQLLQSMTPDQLKSLADQAMKRNQILTKDLFPDAAGEGREATLVVVAAGAGLLADLRSAIETALAQDTKQWRFEGEAMQPDDTVGLRYWVKCKKKLPPPSLRETLVRVGGTMAQDVLLQ